MLVIELVRSNQLCHLLMLSVIEREHH